MSDDYINIGGNIYPRNRPSHPEGEAMNTNDTVDYEIPADWDVTVEGAERRGYRAGVEDMLSEVRSIATEQAARKLLKRLEEKR